MTDDADVFQRLSLDESLRRTFTVYRTGFFVFTKVAGLTRLSGQFSSPS